MFLISACSNPETDDRAIRSVTDAIDLRLSESKPLQVINAEENSNIGFDADNKESRLLIHFPKLTELWDENVIISSIASIELLINCDEVLVNPENIELRPLDSDWTPFATWASRDMLLGTPWSTPGGDFAADLPPVTPSLRINTKAPDTFELSFDITQLVQRMILEDASNYGFLIRVVRSELNGDNVMSFSTTNNEDGNKRPSSALVFSTKDSVEGDK